MACVTKKLSPWQAWWLDQLSKFDYEFIYVLPGVDNTLVDALFRIYSEELAGTVWAARIWTEYQHSAVVVRRAT
jgi:hypothetical protein